MTDKNNESVLAGRTLVFIGGGAMAEALIRGLTAKRVVRPEHIRVIDKAGATRLDDLKNRYGIIPVPEDRAQEAVSGADLVVLAVKPKDAAEAMQQYRGGFSGRQMIVSFVAGLSISSIRRLAGQDVPVARAMPNTSSSIGLGATGLSYSADADDASRGMARELFGAIGIVREVDEPLLDIVTGVSGSGPAYFYYFVEALIAGGIAGGLDEDASRELAYQTILGVAEMLRQTGEPPETLRRNVTSPGGTTEAAIRLMEEAGVADAIRRAVLRAAERAAEMGADIDRTIEQT
jgi:pyrroline-5-carboxylate reductase